MFEEAPSVRLHGYMEAEAKEGDDKGALQVAKS